MAGKCPYCQSVVTSVKATKVIIPPRYQGLSYSCLNCDTVLSVQMNPVWLNSEFIKKVVKIFFKRS